MSQRIVGIIPARLESERMPGKVLYTVQGKTLIQHTFEHACRVKAFSEVYIATDSPRIAETSRSFGARVIMTSSACRNGSERVAEACRQVAGDIIVNIQADEPFLPRQAVEEPLQMMLNDRRLDCTTTVTRIRKKEELYDANVVKAVLDREGFALYFSRSLIPFPRAYFSENNPAFNRKVVFYKHIGVYLFRRKFLMKYAALPGTFLEKTEKLEQLRILEHGYRIKVAVIRQDSPCVDTVADLERL